MWKFGRLSEEILKCFPSISEKKISKILYMWKQAHLILGKNVIQHPPSDSCFHWWLPEGGCLGQYAPSGSHQWKHKSEGGCCKTFLPRIRWAWQCPEPSPAFQFFRSSESIIGASSFSNFENKVEFFLTCRLSNRQTKPHIRVSISRKPMVGFEGLWANNNFWNFFGPELSFENYPKIRFWQIYIIYECLAGTNCWHFFDPLLWAHNHPKGFGLG